MDERISQLEDLVTNLRIAEASRDQELKNLASKVAQLGESVDTLNRILANAKGAIWVLSVASAVAGWCVHMLISFLNAGPKA